MKKLILCCFTLTLIACNDVKTVANNTQINSVENKAQTQKFDAQSKKLLPKDSRWQFDKFINVTDEDLKNSFIMVPIQPAALKFMVRQWQSVKAGT